MRTVNLQHVCLCIDPFDKYAAAVPLKSKQPPDILAGLMECFHKMNGKPESIYTDDEGSFNSTIVKIFKG
jgi:hypothetical protein